jgi:hypothetical protein
MSKTICPLIPSHAIAPEEWAKEALARASDYAGMEEASWFLMEARRYLSLMEKISDLERQLAASKLNTLERSSC